MNRLKKIFIIFNIVMVIFVFTGCSDPRDNAVQNLSEMYFGKDFVLVDDFAFKDPTTGAYMLSWHTYVFSDGSETHCIVASEYYKDSDSCLFDLYYNCRIQQDMVVGYSSSEVAYCMLGDYGLLHQ